VGGASDVGTYCADAIKRSVDGFNVSTCIDKHSDYFIMNNSISVVYTYLSIGRLRFHLSRFTIETRATLLVLDVSEITY